MEMCMASALGIAEKVNSNVEALAGVGLDTANIVELAIGLRVGASKHGLTHDTRMRAQQAQVINPPKAHPPEDPGQDDTGDQVPF